MDDLLKFINDAPEHQHKLIEVACRILIARLGKTVNPSQSIAGWNAYISDAHDDMVRLGGHYAFMVAMRLADEILSIPAEEPHDGNAQ